MPVGRVKWFNIGRGFGFIAPKSGSIDVFVQLTDVRKAGLDSLHVGERVSYDLERSRDETPTAINIMSLDRQHNSSR